MSTRAESIEGTTSTPPEILSFFLNTSKPLPYSSSLIERQDYFETHHSPDGARNGGKKMMDTDPEPGTIEFTIQRKEMRRYTQEIWGDTEIINGKPGKKNYLWHDWAKHVQAGLNRLRDTGREYSQDDPLVYVSMAAGVGYVPRRALRELISDDIPVEMHLIDYTRASNMECAAQFKAEGFTQEALPEGSQAKYFLQKDNVKVFIHYGDVTQPLTSDIPPADIVTGEFCFHHMDNDHVEAAASVMAKAARPGGIVQALDLGRRPLRHPKDFETRRNNAIARAAVWALSNWVFTLIHEYTQPGHQFNPSEFTTDFMSALRFDRDTNGGVVNQMLSPTDMAILISHSELGRLAHLETVSSSVKIFPPANLVTTESV